ncbi:hypothetical protein Poli38472_012443 [Pythium oligandrum]|uniref:Alpha N-terminal protein methyltransferase 1 n=1 Tax=Pythium oligandrum TaxID=41045 RepID=A0A8K1CPE5_PYTOL|nr:hypothetical protein Poli38472_012443 [Pythium oligandrum]|eukprot:TMW67327.1 hypothetical protein Poli38472_012443 [Pythium oligandrum]
MASAQASAVDDAAATLSLISSDDVSTRVDWRRLKMISEIIQSDLDDADELDDHSDYSSVYEMWQHELKDVQELEASGAKQAVWYSSANDYWQDEEKCSLDDNGVLGGFAHISPADVHDSKEFIYKLALKRPQWKRDVVVDCGAGIGRVTKNLLLPLFQRVDLIEQSERLLRGVPQYIGRDDAAALSRVRNLYCMGLQDFTPASRSYDLVWIQWVSSHLTDVDFVDFLKRCKAGLAPHGWIAVKENVLLAGSPYEIDRQDSSMTRSDVYFKSIFRQAGLEVIAEETQKNFPEELYPVKMYALA